MEDAELKVPTRHLPLRSSNPIKRVLLHALAFAAIAPAIGGLEAALFFSMRASGEAMFLPLLLVVFAYRYFAIAAGAGGLAIGLLSLVFPSRETLLLIASVPLALVALYQFSPSPHVWDELLPLIVIVTGPATVWLTRWLRRSRNEHAHGARRQRQNRDRWITGLALALALIFVPYFAFARISYREAVTKVPQPLEVLSIEYREEKIWGFGPGGNETGFIVFRLTHSSAAWARAQGPDLSSKLPGGNERWLSTPVSPTGIGRAFYMREGSWEIQDTRPTIEAIVENGFAIDVERSHADDANLAIQNPGSLYSAGRGGFTIIDPQRGKAYFLYAG